jgi:hypothetical protein
MDTVTLSELLRIVTAMATTRALLLVSFYRSYISLVTVVEISHRIQTCISCLNKSIFMLLDYKPFRVRNRLSYVCDNLHVMFFFFSLRFMQ